MRRALDTVTERRLKPRQWAGLAIELAGAAVALQFLAGKV